MNRRSLLKYTAYITGYAAVAPLTSAILSGCKAEAPTTSFKPAFFTESEYQQVSAMVNTMLPPTSTPGAVELGVPEFTDLVLSTYTSEEDREIVKTGLDSWSASIEQQAGKPYHELPTEEQLSLLNQLDEASREQADAIAATNQEYIQQNKDNNADKEKVDEPWWLMLKGIVIGGYYSSEKIGTEVLAYDPVPGPYQGCISLEEVGGRSWSL